jgi:hypothetical protein
MVRAWGAKLVVREETGIVVGSAMFGSGMPDSSLFCPQEFDCNF